MEINSVACTSCGAPIKIPNDIENLNCAYCGAALIVQRGEGYISLKLAEKVSQSIKETGEQTQSTIREGTQVTQAELKKLQLSQELSSTRMQLSALQAEIRSLERQKPTSQIKRQLKDLREQEHRLYSHIQSLQSTIFPIIKPQQAQVSKPSKSKGITVFGVSLSGVLIVFLCVCCLIFGIFANTSESAKATRTARAATKTIIPRMNSESTKSIGQATPTHSFTKIPTLTQTPIATSITETLRIEIDKELKSCCSKSSIQEVRLDGRELIISTSLDRTYLDDFFGTIGSIHGIIGLMKPDVDRVVIIDITGQYQLVITVEMKDLLAYYNNQITWDEYRPKWVIFNLNP